MWVSRAEHERLLADIEHLHEQLAEVRLTVEEPNEWLERVLRKRILVHQENDLSIDGLLVERTDDGVILRTAKLLNPDNTFTPLDGEVWIPREKVAFAQLDE